MAAKRKERLWLWSLLTAAATGFILYNAVQTGTESIGTSDSLIAWLDPLLKAIEARLGELDWNFWVRKAAHVTEYALLGITSLVTARRISARRGYPCGIYAAFYALAVAVTDEFLQSFFDRTSAVYDILIDFGGVLIGFGLVLFVGLFTRKGKRKGGKG